MVDLHGVHIRNVPDLASCERHCIEARLSKRPRNDMPSIFDVKLNEPIHRFHLLTPGLHSRPFLQVKSGMVREMGVCEQADIRQCDRIADEPARLALVGQMLLHEIEALPCGEFLAGELRDSIRGKGLFTKNVQPETERPDTDLVVVLFEEQPSQHRSF